MKLTIDTKADSKEEIRKAIKLLMGIVGTHEIYTNLPEKPQPISPPNIFDNPPSNGDFMNMFDVPSQTTTPDKPEEQKDDVPSLEFY